MAHRVQPFSALYYLFSAWTSLVVPVTLHYLSGNGVVNRLVDPNAGLRAEQVMFKRFIMTTQSEHTYKPSG